MTGLGVGLGFNSGIAATAADSEEDDVIIGQLIQWPSSTLPVVAGQVFAFCDGQSVSKTTYPDLFTVLGYDYGGSGDNFNIPTIEDVLVKAADNTQSNISDSVAGSDTKTITTANMPAHTHSVTDPTVYNFTDDTGGSTNFAGASGDGTSGTATIAATGSAGSGAALNVEAAHVVMAWVIRLS